MTLALTQPFDEAHVRRVGVQEAEGRAAWPKAVLDVWGHREERAGPGAMPGVVEEELDLALEHVERVGVVGVGVRVDTLEVRLVGELERLDLRQLGEETMAPRAAPS